MPPREIPRFTRSPRGGGRNDRTVPPNPDTTSASSACSIAGDDYFSSQSVEATKSDRRNRPRVEAGRYQLLPTQTSAIAGGRINCLEQLLHTQLFVVGCVIDDGPPVRLAVAGEVPAMQLPKPQPDGRT